MLSAARYRVRDAAELERRVNPAAIQYYGPSYHHVIVRGSCWLNWLTTIFVFGGQPLYVTYVHLRRWFSTQKQQISGRDECIVPGICQEIRREIEADDSS